MLMYMYSCIPWVAHLRTSQKFGNGEVIILIIKCAYIKVPILFRTVYIHMYIKCQGSEYKLRTKCICKYVTIPLLYVF